MAHHHHHYKLKNILLTSILLCQIIFLAHCLLDDDPEHNSRRDTVVMENTPSSSLKYKQPSSTSSSSSSSSSGGSSPKKAILLEKKTDLKLLDNNNKKFSNLTLPKSLSSSPSSSSSSLLTSSSSSLLSSDLRDQAKRYSEQLSESLRKIKPEYEEFDEKNFTSLLEKFEHDKEAVRMNHSYFESTFYSNPKDAMALWIDMQSFNETQFVHEVLSNSHRRAASISLPFNFTFYGNNLNRTTVATGGFLYMGEHVHSWLAATQYIAPLMANFDTRNSTPSQILYGYNSSVFVIQWDNVMLQEKPELEFTFQCAIHPNGDIVFVYKHIPIPIEEIPEINHPVKVGVSDAYFINRHQIFVRRKTIYEYHKIDIMKADQIRISNNTAIYLKALPTCNSFKTCESCLKSVTPFNCGWCDAVKRCSDGYDRQRQEWVANHCDLNALHNLTKCSASLPISNANNSSSSASPASSSSSSTTSSNSPSNNSNASTSNITPSPTVFHNGTGSIDDHHHSEINPFDVTNKDKNLTNLEYNTQEQRLNPSKISKTHSSLAITLFMIISLILGTCMWIVYAYRNPTSASGQFLIRWRPSKWRWNGGHTRYTAASIHM